MNEQDFMNKIKEQTKDIPIPDKISPENMKKMLDENKEQVNKKVTELASAKRRRTIRNLSAAACLVLVFSGAIGLSQMSHKNTGTSDAIMELTNSDSATDDVAADEAPDFADDTAGNAADSVAEIDSTPSDESDHTNFDIPDGPLTDSTFKTAKSYEDFYDVALKVEKAYEKKMEEYYKQATNDLDYEETIAEDDAVTDYVESAADDSADRNYSSSSDQADTGASKDFSTTNTQESTIDEGDIIKTDGEYIYRLSRYNDTTIQQVNSKIAIVKANNGKMQHMADIKASDFPKWSSSAEFTFHEFYLYENKIVIIYSLYDYLTTSYTEDTYIVTYDISDKTNPQLIGTVNQSGEYVTSRISNGFLYTISSCRGMSFHDKKDYESYIPKVNDTILPCDKIYYCEDNRMTDDQVMTAMDLNKPDQLTDNIAIPISDGNAYVSENAIYFYTNYYLEQNITKIMKVYYKDGKFITSYDASINGYLYGPFAINEQNGYLRIVATVPAHQKWTTRENGIRGLIESVTSKNTDTKNLIDVTGNRDEDSNVLYVLDSKLQLAGSIAGIAKGERIYSARFIKDMGYFVTYRNTDPLFSVDLSDPTNPRLIGALKIPGFSNYLHPYGNNILLGFGQARDEATQEFLGLKLSMFNISDPTNVVEEDMQILSEAIWSPATANYKSMMIDVPKNIFGFAYESNSYDSIEDSIHFVTYSYDETYGFVETGKYTIPLSDDSYWDDVRGVYIGDYLYVSSAQYIYSYPLYKSNVVDQITLY